MTNKYFPLQQKLARSKAKVVTMTFADIEKVIGAKLPKNSSGQRAWWSNNPTNARITHAWLGAGRRVSNVDIMGRKASFVLCADAKKALVEGRSPKRGTDDVAKPKKARKAAPKRKPQTDAQKKAAVEVSKSLGFIKK